MVTTADFVTKMVKHQKTSRNEKQRQPLYWIVFTILTLSFTPSQRRSLSASNAASSIAEHSERIIKSANRTKSSPQLILFHRFESDPRWQQKLITCSGAFDRHQQRARENYVQHLSPSHSLQRSDLWHHGSLLSGQWASNMIENKAICTQEQTALIPREHGSPRNRLGQRVDDST